MSITIPLDRIEILLGQSLCLHQIDWQKFEAILTELGEKRRSRIAFYDGTLEIRRPLPEHERMKSLYLDKGKTMPMSAIRREFHQFLNAQLGENL